MYFSEKLKQNYIMKNELNIILNNNNLYNNKTTSYSSTE